jgi:Asp-tRNA(Asn)/Glu-tRNA(Gln) amidotransferase A subunit family amidase
LLVASAPLAVTAASLRNGELDLLMYIDQTCNRIETNEPLIHALLPEQNRRTRLMAEARELQARFPDPPSRPPLYGILLGVKDVFCVNGFPTRAGSQLPPELFEGPEATCVTLLRDAGALALNKTISTEFAYFEPGPTRNPHNLNHTPGGSSSGSAAAVAAGFCPLALGTQTIGSTIRPAAFCGIVGFKPSYGRVSTMGMVPCAPSLDTVGFFTQDVAGIALMAPLLCFDWQEAQPSTLPILGVPDGPYLVQASPEGLAAFEEQLLLLQEAGYVVRRVRAMDDIEAINQRNMRLVCAEMARIHTKWFARYQSLYRPRTAQAILDGQQVSLADLTQVRAGRATLRAELETLMMNHGIDLWICPSTPGPAPEGIAATGSPVMNLPWTHAGMPAISLPAGYATNGLPLGLQAIGIAMADEKLVSWTRQLAELLIQV